MAAKRKKKPKREIKHFNEIESYEDALLWLENDPHLSRYEAEELERDYEDLFAWEYQYFGDDDLAGISNWRSWKRDFKDTEGGRGNWWDVGGWGVLVKLLDHEGEKTPEAEAIESLEGYPILDENDYSDLEHTNQIVNWNDYGRHDLKRDMERKASPIDAEAVEALLEEIDNETFDTIVRKVWEDKGDYPETEGAGTNFPNIIQGWGGSLLELGEILSLDEFGYVIEASLAEAAFDKNGKLLLRPQDLPNELKTLLTAPKIRLPLGSEFCDSPYISCRLIKGEPEQISEQTNLPGVSERRRRKRR